jgi:amino acid transporter
MASTAGPQGGGTLAKNAVGPWGGWIASITNVGPTLAMALILVAYVTSAGQTAPALLIIGGLLMLPVALAYHRMNQWKPNASGPVAWLRSSVSPAIGFAAGILIIFLCIFSVVANITVLGSVLLGAVAPSLASNVWLEWLIGVVLVCIVSFIAIEGIRPSIRFESVIVWFEYAIVVGFAIAILVAVTAGHLAGSIHPSISWFNPGHTIGGFSGVIVGVILAVFTYSGWENPVYLAEEQKRPRSDPGREAIRGLLFATVFLAFLMFCFQGVASPSALSHNAGNVLAYAAGRVASHPWTILMTLAVMSSFTAATQAVLAYGSRTAFGMARDGALPPGLARVHPRLKTPWVALAVLTVIPIGISVFYFLSTGVASIINDLVATLGYLFTVIYAAVALACVWCYRKRLLQSARELIVGGILPFVSAGFFVYAIVDSLPNAGAGVIVPTIVVAVGGTVAGFILSRTMHTPFFTVTGESRSVPREGFPATELVTAQGE